MSATPGQIWVRRALDPDEGPIDGLHLEWRDGRFSRVEPCAQPPAGVPENRRFGHHLLTPGLLNAHAHLDYAFLQGRLPRGVGFTPWLREMFRERGALAARGGRMDEERSACRRGLQQALDEGTTEIWDIHTYGWGRAALAETGLPHLSFIEFFTLSGRRWRNERDAWFYQNRLIFGQLGRDAQPDPNGAFSPHAAYTVIEPALRFMADWARRHGWPMAMHLAESPEERELLVDGTGSLGDFMSEALGLDVAAELGPGRTAIRRALDAGVAGPDMLAIHGNGPDPGEPELLAGSGSPVVFCPLSHRFFGYPAWPLAAYRAAGVRMALGTDSLASNDGLSIRGELRRLRELAEGWSAKELLGCATGRMLGEAPPFGGRGRLAVGAPARWAVWRPESAPGETAEALLESMLDPRTRLERSSARE